MAPSRGASCRGEHLLPEAQALSCGQRGFPAQKLALPQVPLVQDHRTAPLSSGLLGMREIQGRASACGCGGLHSCSVTRTPRLHRL